MRNEIQPLGVNDLMYLFYQYYTSRDAAFVDIVLTVQIIPRTRVTHNCYLRAEVESSIYSEYGRSFERCQRFESQLYLGDSALTVYVIIR